MALIRFGISLDESLLRQFDALIERKGYTNRSEAIRDLIRDALVEDELSAGAEAIGVITIVYSHETRELADTLNDLQHEYHKEIISALHVHLSAHKCLEVILVKGKSNDIKTIFDRLRGLRGVVHGDLSMTTTGEALQ